MQVVDPGKQPLDVQIPLMTVPALNWKLLGGADGPTSIPNATLVRNGGLVIPLIMCVGGDDTVPLTGDQ